MTAEERFDRIEHVTAGLVEERRKDREEYRQLWRDTQRQIGELTIRMNDLAIRMNDLTIKMAENADAIRTSDERAKSAEQDLRDRVDTLVSAIGEYIRSTSRPPPSPPRGP